MFIEAGRFIGVVVKVFLFKEFFHSLPTEETSDIGIFGVASVLVAELVQGGVRAIHGITIAEIHSNHPIYGCIVYGKVILAAH